MRYGRWFLGWFLTAFALPAMAQYGQDATYGQGVTPAGPRPLFEQAADPTVSTDIGWLYTKDSAGATELYYKDATGNVVQLTTAGAVGGGALALADDVQARWGSSADFVCEYDTTNTPDAMVCGVSSDSRALIITEKADVSTNYGHALQPNPTVWIHSADQTDVNDYLGLSHDTSMVVFNSGNGGFAFADRGTNRVYIDDTGIIAATQKDSTSGSPDVVFNLIGGAHTNVTAGANVTAFSIVGQSLDYAAGNIATLQFAGIVPPTVNIGGAGGNGTDWTGWTVSKHTLGAGVGTVTNNDALTAVGPIRAKEYLWFDTGTAVVATKYGWWRNADATNVLQGNVPTGASFEWSVNDVAQLSLDASTLNLQANTITGVGSAITGTQGTALTISIATGATTGDDLIVAGGNAGAGDNKAGDLDLKPGVTTGSGQPATVSLWANSGGSVSQMMDFVSTGAGLAGLRFAGGTTSFSWVTQSGPTAYYHFRVDGSVASSVNYLQVSGAATGAEPVLAAVGDDADIDARVNPKGAGNLTTTGGFTSSATGALGWTIQTAANQVCTTTCISACAVGWDTAAGEVSVGCADATADKCLCAGSS